MSSAGDAVSTHQWRRSSHENPLLDGCKTNRLKPNKDFKQLNNAEAFIGIADTNHSPFSWKTSSILLFTVQCFSCQNWGTILDSSSFIFLISPNHTYFERKDPGRSQRTLQACPVVRLWKMCAYLTILQPWVLKYHTWWPYTVWNSGNSMVEKSTNLWFCGPYPRHVPLSKLNRACSKIFPLLGETIAATGCLVCRVFGVPSICKLRFLNRHLFQVSITTKNIKNIWLTFHHGQV